MSKSEGLTRSTGDVRFVLCPEAIDQAPLQFDTGEMSELTLLAELTLLSVLAVDRTDELGDKPLVLRTTVGSGLGRGAGRTELRTPCRPEVLS